MAPMFSAMVVGNRKTFWDTSAICPRRASRFHSSIRLSKMRYSVQTATAYRLAAALCREAAMVPTTV